MDSLKSSKIIALKEQLHFLKLKFQEIKLLSYLGNEIEEVISYVESLAYEFDEKLIEYEKNDVSKNDLKLLLPLINIYYIQVGRIVNCDVKNNPREVMIPIKEILNEVHGEHIFITEPIWDLNYWLGILFNKNYMEYLRKCSISIKKKNNTPCFS